MEDAVMHVLGDILPTAGVGGVLALVMFYFVRRDGEANASRFANLFQQQAARNETLIELVKENTASATRLATVIEALRWQFDREYRR
jgi:hypothetical protein